MTSAPKSARMCVHCGPEITQVKSRIRISARRPVTAGRGDPTATGSGASPAGVLGRSLLVPRQDGLLAVGEVVEEDPGLALLLEHGRVGQDAHLPHQGFGLLDVLR